jgi:hypothetical protein
VYLAILYFFLEFFLVPFSVVFRVFEVVLILAIQPVVPVVLLQYLSLKKWVQEYPRLPHQLFFF